MPIIKSAKKRVRVSSAATARNRRVKRSVKTAVKAFTAALGAGGKKASEAQRQAQSELDKAAKKGIIHKNKAARKKAQLAKAAKTTTNIKVPVAAAKKTTGAKKATSKKTTAKK